MRTKSLVFFICSIQTGLCFGQLKSLFDKQPRFGHSVEKEFQPASASFDYSTAHLMPFFGEVARTASQIEDDNRFLALCKKNFKSRSDASEFFSARGWDYLAEAQIDTATYRFNLAWLLDKENVEVYWGLGVISYQKGNFVDAIRFMEKGQSMDPSNVTLMVDLATVRLKRFIKDQNLDDLKAANSILEKATKIAPDFADAYQKWSLTAFHEGRFDKAWTYFHRSYELEPSSVDVNFLKDLISKSPDPKGVFKH